MVDPLLREALEPVLHDLQRSGLVEPRVEDRDWTGDPDQPSVMLWSADGSGSGVSVTRSGAPFERIASVADQVQEWVIEEQWAGHAPTNWPVCPRHPGSHPLAASTADGVAVWVCPDDQQAVSPIGGL